MTPAEDVGIAVDIEGRLASWVNGHILVSHPE